MEQVPGGESSSAMAEDTYRSERKAVAAQACDTCRLRKSRCDEQRPQCGLCRRLGVKCEYRETKPTKKDKTLEYILQTLQNLERKIDQEVLNRAVAVQQPPEASTNPSTAPTPSYNSGSTRFSGIASPPSIANLRPRSSPSTAATTPVTHPTDLPITNSLMQPTVSLLPNKFSLPSFAVPYQHSTAANLILAWPAVRSLLQPSLLRIPSFEGDRAGGVKWHADLSRYNVPLYTSDHLEIVDVDPRHPSGIGGGDGGALPLPMAMSDKQIVTVTPETITALCAAFFNSFHWAYPVLDRGHFYNAILPRALANGFDEREGGSVLVLMVLALGSIADDGWRGREFETSTSNPQIPPGVVFFAEAERRFGWSMLRPDVVVLQCAILFAVYFAQCSRNWEFWQMTVHSCTICQILVQTIENWNVPESDLIARCYWMCVLLEGGPTSELQFPPTGITDLQDSVPFPLFLTTEGAERDSASDDMLIMYHFLAQITIRKIINTVNQVLGAYQTAFPTSDPSPSSASASASGGGGDADTPTFASGPPHVVISELARQLDEWRTHLPPMLRWEDPIFPHDLDPASPDPFLRPDRGGAGAEGYDYRVFLEAILRTRYKYALYLIWRPYLYKVLHFPEMTGREDRFGCEQSLKACSLWPITFPYFQQRRRLIPHLYEWSHTLFGILTLLYVSAHNGELSAFAGQSLKAGELALSTDFFLDWMRYMSRLHPVARWAWQLLEVLYEDHEKARERDN